MIRIACDLCQTTMKTGDTSKPYHFCERCAPFGEDYVKGVDDLRRSAFDGFVKAVERLRAETVRTKIAKKTQELKAV